MNEQDWFDVMDTFQREEFFIVFLYARTLFRKKEKLYLIKFHFSADLSFGHFLNSCGENICPSNQILLHELTLSNCQSIRNTCLFSLIAF